MASRTRWGKTLPLLFVFLLISFVGNIAFMVKDWSRQVVVSVPDGDSLQLADGRRIRLLGIDAPEKGRCMADEAREKLSSLALGKHMRLKHTVTDDYGRTLANVIVQDLSTWISYMRGETDPLVSRVLLRNGLARFESVNTPYKSTLEQASTFAKGNKLGIYSESCRKTVAPEGCRIKGNIREGKPVYYLPNCKYYDQVIVDEAFGDQWFCSAADAQKTGFAFAPSCK